MSLALTKIFHSSKHVSRYSFLVFNNLFHNNCFRETLLNSFRHYCLSCPVQQSLFAVTESVARNLTQLWIPYIITVLLLPRTPVAVCLLIHPCNFSLLFQTSASWVNSHFSLIRDDVQLYSKCNVIVGYFFRPLVLSGIRHAQWLTDVRGIFPLLHVDELSSQSIQILSLDSLVHRLTELCFPTKGIPTWWLKLTFLKTRMHNNLARLDVISFTVLLNMIRSSWIVWLILWE